MTLLCTVRGCRMPLERKGSALVCARRHSFDVARSGYVNLLQPQDRRSKNPGDTAEAVAARRRFFDRGLEGPLTEGIVSALPLRPDENLLDVGCGAGSYLAAFGSRAAPPSASPANHLPPTAHRVGLDISVPAIELAARRYPHCTWLVANADRFLPFPDRSFAALLSITARMNPEEFRRVLAPDGALLVVLPGADDLFELRKAVLGEGLELDRVERTVALFEPLFALQSRQTLRHRVLLDRPAMLDVMSSSYRGLRTRERERLAELEPTETTLSRDVLRFR